LALRRRAEVRERSRLIGRVVIHLGAGDRAVCAVGVERALHHGDSQAAAANIRPMHRRCALLLARSIDDAVVMALRHRFTAGLEFSPTMGVVRSRRIDWDCAFVRSDD
jgi:hypothetical protein